MALRISVFESKELQTAILALKGMDREIRKQIRQHTRPMALEAWKEATRANAITRSEIRVLADTARVAVSDQNIMLQAARIGRPLSGGLRPSELWHHIEFGADRTYKTTVTSKLGKRYERHTRRQFRERNREGYVVYPAASQIIPRLASLWVQTVIRTFYEEMESNNG